MTVLCSCLSLPWYAAKTDHASSVTRRERPGSTGDAPCGKQPGRSSPARCFAGEQFHHFASSNLRVTTALRYPKSALSGEREGELRHSRFVHLHFHFWSAGAGLSPRRDAGNLPRPSVAPAVAGWGRLEGEICNGLALQDSEAFIPLLT